MLEGRTKIFVWGAWSLCLPNEDFGRRNKRWSACFRGTFRGCEYLIWATNHCKVPRKSAFHLFFRLPKSSFGEHKVVTKDIVPKKNRRIALPCYDLYVSSCKLVTKDHSVQENQRISMLLSFVSSCKLLQKIHQQYKHRIARINSCDVLVLMGCYDLL